jgi:acid phosphatase type 7
VIGSTLAVTLLVLSFGVRPEAGPTTELTRGPYLQLATPTSLIVRWRTDLASIGRVRFGSAPGNLVSFVDETHATTEHVVALQGLLPSTTYFYSVGDLSGPLAGDDAEHFFTTPPPVGTSGAYRIWVLGDPGTADANARAVRDAFDAWNGSDPVDLWLMLGDNAYNSGTDSEYQAAVFGIYPQYLRRSTLWPTFGNHDGVSANSSTQTGPYYDIFSLPKAAEAGGVASGTEAYYSFDFGNIHFICLNSHDLSRAPNGPMLTWLAADLAANSADWTIAFFHHPPYSKGSHNSDTAVQLIEMRENALPILEAGGVDLVLTGHSHSYERSYLLDGHYGHSMSLTPAMIKDNGDGRPAGDGPYAKPSGGTTANEGTVYVVAGSSGKVTQAPLNHPAMVFSAARLGSMVLDIQGQKLDATFLGTKGVLETFTMVKGPVIFEDGFESGTFVAWSSREP